MVLALLIAAGVCLAALAVLLALDFVYQQTINHGQDVITSTVTVSTDANDKVYAEIPVAASSTVNYTGCAGSPAAIKAVMIKTDANMTLTINYASGSDDVYTLVAGEPLGWNNKMNLGDPFVNTNAIVSMDFNNATATDGIAYLMIARDSAT